MILEPKCSKRNCAHYLGVRQPEGMEGNEFAHCLAFPDGIPDEIAYGEDKHMSKHPDQNNDIVFEKE